jgi:hypothetical protein
LAIGNSLIKNALLWMDGEGASTKIVEAGAGNEQVFGFYAHYWFLALENDSKTNRKMIYD